MLHLKSSDFFQLKLLHSAEVCAIALLLCWVFFFFFKLVLAAGGKGMILNGLMCYKRHKEAASSTSYPAVTASRGLGVSGMTKNYNSTYQWLTLGFFQTWFLPFQLIFFFLTFLPLLSPIHSNFFNLWKWNTAWLASCEDLPTPTLTHKYLLSSQYFGKRPSVFIVHGSFWNYCS